MSKKKKVKLQVGDLVKVGSGFSKVGDIGEVSELYPNGGYRVYFDSFEMDGGGEYCDFSPGDITFYGTFKRCEACDRPLTHKVKTTFPTTILGAGGTSHTFKYSVCKDCKKRFTALENRLRTKTLLDLNSRARPAKYKGK